MAGYPLISLLDPQPYDLVEHPILASGIGTAVEGSEIQARLRDADGNEITRFMIQAGSLAGC